MLSAQTNLSGSFACFANESFVSRAMKLTRERKIGGVVLGLALVAFCADRLMGTSSSDEATAVAGDPPTLLMASATSPTTHPAAASITSGNDAPSLAQRLAT